KPTAGWWGSIPCNTRREARRGCLSLLVFGKQRATPPIERRQNISGCLVEFRSIVMLVGSQMGQRAPSKSQTAQFTLEPVKHAVGEQKVVTIPHHRSRRRW